MVSISVSDVNFCRNLSKKKSTGSMGFLVGAGPGDGLCDLLRSIFLEESESHRNWREPQRQFFRAMFFAIFLLGPYLIFYMEISEQFELYPNFKSV